MPIDYFGKWFTESGFDFTGLINADFVQPVRILFQSQHYVSATKLLLVAVDSLGYIEYGDTKKNPFVSWLDTYANLSSLNITPEELWEHRNSLLHMSNLTSRKVNSGSVRMLIGYLGHIPQGVKLEDDVGYYNIKELIMSVASAIAKWCQTYGTDRDKIDQFVARYDLIASDDRMLRIDMT